jgi:hypothetical protein
MARNSLNMRLNMRVVFITLGIVLVSLFGYLGGPWSEVSATPSGQTVTVTVGTVPTATSTPLPTATATATSTPTPTPTPTPTNTPVVDAASVEIEVVLTSTSSTATDTDGNTVEVTSGGKISVEKSDSAIITIALPLVLASGKNLESFEDTSSGVTVATNASTGKVEVTIPVKSDDGATQANIVAQLASDLAGTGTAAQGVVEELALVTVPQTVDLSSLDADVGDVKVQLTAILNDIPEAANISISVSDKLNINASSSFALAAQNAQTSIKDVAYAITVKKVGLADQAMVASSEISMCVGSSWYTKNGGSAALASGLFAIFRLDDAGRRETLPTTLSSESATQACFLGTSNKGLSTFALVALDTPLLATPTPVPPTLSQERSEISPAAAATISSVSKEVSVNIPVGGVPALVDVQITDVDRADVREAASMYIVGPQFELEVLADGTVLSDFRFSESVDLVLSYSDADIAVGMGESQLRVVRWNPGVQQWISIGGTLDPVNRTVTALARRQGLYSLASLLPPPTPTATLAPGATPEAPIVGDITPPSWVLFALAVFGFVLVSTGVYYLRSPRREQQS